MEHISGLSWRTSSYSGGNGGACVEVAARTSGGVLVRDTRDRQGPALRFTVGAWKRFADRVRSGAC